MFSADNFYNYLVHTYSEGNFLEFETFDKHGARGRAQWKPFGDVPDSPRGLNSRVALLDQEPIEFEYFGDWITFDPKNLNDPRAVNPEYYKNLKMPDVIFRELSGTYTPIVCHSERNSPEVALFEENYFDAVHYFYHGLLAREWFRHWKHYNMKHEPTSSRFGLYARDGSGSRTYRLDLLAKLTTVKDQTYFKLQPEIANQLPTTVRKQWQQNDVIYSSDSSATISVEDASRFQIQIVPETLFRTTKTHLTEKVFKPMVMRQPFILVAPPNSLEYLKSYGFRTFDGLWSERYDKELDPDKRMEMVMDVIQYLASLNTEAFARIMDRAQSIVEFNHKHFFSHEFEDQMLLELQNNFRLALDNRKEKFYSMPGGTWFYYQDKIFNETGMILDWNKNHNAEIIKYLRLHDEKDLATKIRKKYKHLF